MVWSLLRAVSRWPFLASALVLALQVLAACGDSSSPPASPVSPTPLSTATVTPIPAPSTVYRLVYRQFGQEQDTIWRVDPADPSRREQMAVISHRVGWGIMPSLSPDGRLLAYTAFPEGAFEAGSQSKAYILDLGSGETELIADGVDLHLRPLWSPDGILLFLRRTTEEEVMILQADLTKPEGDPERVRVILRARISDVLTLDPVGFAEDNHSVYIAQIQGGVDGGTVLSVYSPTTGVTPLVRLSEQIARDYDLSPDSKWLTFLAQELVEGRLVFRAFMADLAGGSVVPISTEGLGDGEHLRPLWHPDGTRIALGQLPLAGQGGPVALVPLGGGAPSFLASPGLGFDVPQSWAPDGSYLAVISMEGGNPARSRLELISLTGQRITVAEGADALVVGWVKR